MNLKYRFLCFLSCALYDLGERLTEIGYWIERNQNKISKARASLARVENKIRKIQASLVRGLIRVLWFLEGK